MATYAVKKDNETNERLIKRWKKQVQKSRVMQEVRSRRYVSKAVKKRIIRMKALKREDYREKRAREQFYA